MEIALSAGLEGRGARLAIIYDEVARKVALLTALPVLSHCLRLSTRHGQTGLARKTETSALKSCPERCTVTSSRKQRHIECASPKGQAAQACFAAGSV